MSEQADAGPAMDDGSTQNLTVGAQLHSLREAQGKSLEDIAHATRVPMRHLIAIENADYAALPGRTYAVGFTKAFALAVGLDPEEVSQRLHGEMAAANPDRRPYDSSVFAPADPARVPPRMLAWGALAILVLLIAIYAIWRATLPTPNPVEAPISEDSASAEAAPASPAPPPPAPVAANAPVALTATEDVWLRIYEAGDKSKLLEKTLAKGESFTIPATAKAPLLLTGRADALQVTVDGKPLARFANGQRTIRDFPVDAQSLTAPASATAPAPSTAAPAQ